MFFRHPRTAKRAAIVLAFLGALGAVAGFALAASGPPTPVISSHPSSPTASTSASFSFTDSQAGVTFSCSLDGGAYAACTSPKAYSSLAAGSHTFRVEAQAKSGTSASASFTWTIDLTPPSTTIVAPANGASYNAAGWSAACTPGPRVCGTASDPSGVTQVMVSIKQNATGMYWAGGGYTSSSEVYQTATLSSATTTGASWSYGLSLPAPDGQYTFHVRAVDSVGNSTPSTSPASSVFTIDRAAPPAPSLTAKPASLTNQTTSSFSFSDTEAGVSYLCRIDAGSYRACTSPTTYYDLSQGSHTFSVEAQDAAGNISSAVSYSWVIDTTAPPAPVITGHPSNPSHTTVATFSFSDSEAGVSYVCKLDGPTYQPCTNPVTYTNLTVGPHQFVVRAVDAAGNLSMSTEYDWLIVSTTGLPFTMSGGATGLLYPGAPARSIAVTLTNPNTTAIYVTSVTATLQSSGLPSGCGVSNFTIAQASIPSAGVNVPANGSVTLPAQGATAPTIQMLDTHVNQNACQKATVTFTYTGSAHS
jgi:hypothetical protein